MKKAFIILNFTFYIFNSFCIAQDLIVKRDSSVIFCKIVKEDSATIYYRQKMGEQTMELNIKKVDVISYYNKRAIVQGELKRTDSLAQVKPKRDSVQVKMDSIQAKIVSVFAATKDPLKPKKDTLQVKKDSIKAISSNIAIRSDSILKRIASYQNSKSDSLQKILAAITTKPDSVKPKKDTTQTKAVMVRSRSDSIFLNINYRCFYKGEQITKKEALNFMKRDTVAYKEMRKARAYYAPVIPLGIGSAILATEFIIDAVARGDFRWVVGGTCLIGAALAVTFKHNCNVHLYKAVKQYNANRDIAVTYIPKFELGAASSGIGLCLKF
jgi:hypothetical protein